MSDLLAHGRAHPRGMVPAQRTRARRGEALMDALAPYLADRAAFAALHEALAAPPEARTAALGALASDLAARPPGPAEAHALARYLDALIDVETLAVDLRAGAVSPRLTGPVLDAALGARALLPPATDPRLAPFPPIELHPSASRRWTVRAGYATDRGAAALGLRFGVIDEQPGTQRAARLRPSARTVFLVSDLSLHWDGRGAPTLDASRFTVLRLEGFGHGVRATDGALGSRLGLALGLGLESTPSAPERTSGVALHAGARLTVAADEAFSDYLVLGLDLRLGAWIRAEYPVRASLDAGLP